MFDLICEYTYMSVSTAGVLHQGIGKQPVTEYCAGTALDSECSSEWRGGGASARRSFPKWRVLLFSSGSGRRWSTRLV